MKKLTTTLLALAALTQLPQFSIAQGLNQLKFGPQQEQTGNRVDGVAAIVGNDIITIQEFNRVGGDKAALERLILEKLLVQKAKERNIVIGDTALNIALDEVRRKGKKVSRKQLKQRLMIDKLRQGVANSLVNISDEEINTLVEQQLAKSDTRLQLIDILIRIPKSADSEALQHAQDKTQRILTRLKSESPQAIARNDNSVIYNDLGWVELSKVPASFASVLIDAPTNEFLSPIVDRDGIHLLKVLARKSDKSNSKVATPPETRVSHILIKDQDNPNAKTMINDVYAQLLDGADFAQLAQQYSQDLGSAANGGSLDWAYPGQMVPDFEAVMNTTKVGRISRPFKSPFGYHILKVHERRQGSTNNREALVKKARHAIFQKRASEEWDLWLSRLRDEAYVEILK